MWHSRPAAAACQPRGSGSGGGTPETRLAGHTLEEEREPSCLHACMPGDASEVAPPPPCWLRPLPRASAAGPPGPHLPHHPFPPPTHPRSHTAHPRLAARCWLAGLSSLVLCVCVCALCASCGDIPPPGTAPAPCLDSFVQHQATSRAAGSSSTCTAGSSSSCQWAAPAAALAAMHAVPCRHSILVASGRGGTDG